jgi:hypothetical protein
LFPDPAPERPSTTGASSPYRRTRDRNKNRTDASAHASKNARKPDRAAKKPNPFVFPQPSQIVSQTLPDVLVATAAAIVLLIGPLEPLGVPIWTFGLLIPSLLIILLSNSATRPLWRRTAFVNMLVLGLVFPVLVVRQSVVQIPYLDSSNGTLLAPLLTTIGIAFVLVMIAIVSAVLSNEDPEYAGVLFLPAAMLVPLLAGPTEITGFKTALLGIALIYFFVALLTVVASMLPGAYPTLVAPVAIAIEFLALPANRAGAAFPLGSGWMSKLLFFGIVFVAVALAIVVPTLSLWVRETRRLMNQRSHIGSV